MIGTTISYQLEGADLTVKIRPADLFAAEDQLGFDPLERFSDAAALERPSTGALRALVTVTWAAHRRTHDQACELEAFTAGIDGLPAASLEADAARPTLAAASGE